MNVSRKQRPLLESASASLRAHQPPCQGAASEESRRVRASSSPKPSSPKPSSRLDAFISRARGQERRIEEEPPAHTLLKELCRRLFLQLRHDGVPMAAMPYTLSMNCTCGTTWDHVSALSMTRRTRRTARVDMELALFLAVLLYRPEDCKG